MPRNEFIGMGREVMKNRAQQQDQYQVLAQSLAQNRVSRRQVLWLLAAGTLSACANSPVGGGSILVGMDEDEERATDRKLAPQQFSQDLGAIQDEAVNRYVTSIGQRLDANVHRPQMPYNYRVLNANYVNAYTFPGGAMGVTRGILVDLDNEAQLAALLGHELGHVNARHAAQRQGQAKIAQVAMSGASLVGSLTGYGGLVDLGSQLGASVLLSSYSRDNEREADALGQEYMVRAGYPASGMVALQQMLVDQEKSSPGMLQTMFSTHPMSSERRDRAKSLAESKYANSLRNDLGRERFLDNIASLRRIRPTIQACQQGEVAMAGKQYSKAEERFATALKSTPRDYAANYRMAECLQARERAGDAVRYAETATQLYPQEAQAHKLLALLSLGQKDPGTAYDHLDRYDRLLPGDAGVGFLKGVALEGQGRRQEAARQYSGYLQQNRQGKAAEYAYSRLRSWGYAQ